MSEGERVPPGSDINKNEPQIWQTYDDGYIVRAMRPEEAEIVQAWYSGMGIISRHDLDTALAVFPPGEPGFYIGEYRGEVVSSAIRIPWGAGVYYGSYYYVAKDYRAKGFGTRLRDQVAFGHVGKNTLCVDAVTGKVTANNQKKFGYEHRWVTERYQGEAKDDFGVTYSGTIKEASDVDFEKLIEYDNKCFVSRDNPQRREFIKRWAAIEGGAAYVATDENDVIVGTGYRRPCIQEGHTMVGPLYADSPEVAEALLQRLVKGVSGNQFTINIWKPNEGAGKMVQKFDMKQIFECNRMHANGDAKEFKDTVFGVTSIDTCGF